MHKKKTQIASLIEQDIRQRGLREGDRYIGTRDVARMLGISTKTANIALQELAGDGVLVRRQRSGTYIGPHAIGSDAGMPKCVHMLMRGSYSIYARPFIDEFLVGMQREFPDDAVQLTFMPEADELRFVRSLVDTLTASGLLDGIVLFLSSPTVQRYCVEAKVPAVVAGSVYPEVSGLPWVDIDQREIGRLLARYAVEHGHRKVAVLMRDQWSYDDDLFMDGVQAGIAGAATKGIVPSVRTIHQNTEVTIDTIRGILSARERPTALICRSARILRHGVQVAEELGLSIPDELLLVVGDCLETKDGPPKGEASRYPYMATSIDGEDHGALVGRMLRQVIRGERPDPDHHIIPVTLRDPYTQHMGCV